MYSSGVINNDKTGVDTQTIFQRTESPIFQDMTEDFFSALKDLSVGELVHHSSFSLEDSITALEMMDPKMDSGLKINDESGWDINTELSPYEILGLMDKMYAAEMTWHSGYFLSQTVFTNVYIQELLLERQGIIDINDFYLKSGENQSIYKDLTNAVLWPFVIASIKTCGILCQAFNKGFLYEEEEISFNSFGLSLLDDVDTVDSLKLLESSISWLNSHSNDFCEKDQKYIKAIQSRLKIRIVFLRVLNSSSTIDIISDLEYIIDIINKEISIFDFGDKMDVFFSISVQAKLLTAMPPRPMIIFPIDVAFNNFEYMCKDFREILLLSTQELFILTPSNVLNFFKYFRVKKPNPNTFIRIMLQSLFVSNNMILNKIPIHQFIIDSISEIYLPAKELFDFLNEFYKTYNGSEHCIFSSVNSFIKTASQIYINIFCVLCHNPSRQRRNLCKLVLDLESLQIEAENVDIQLQLYFFKELTETSDHLLFPYIFSSWCFYEKLQIMILVCFMGFELELHSLHELSLIYWYLDYLLGTYRKHLNRIFTSFNINFFENKSPNTHFYEKDDMTILAIKKIKFDQDWTKGLQLMCNAFYKFFLVLKQFSLVRSPNKQVQKSFMYKQRFKPFLSLKTPFFLEYETFIKESDISEIPILQLFKDILNNFLKARTIFETIKKTTPEISNTLLCYNAFQENIANIIQSSIENELICEMIVQRVINSDDLYNEVFINVNYKYHSWFPVISMTSKS